MQPQIPRHNFVASKIQKSEYTQPIGRQNEDNIVGCIAPDDLSIVKHHCGAKCERSSVDVEKYRAKVGLNTAYVSRGQRMQNAYLCTFGRRENVRVQAVLNSVIFMET